MYTKKHGVHLGYLDVPETRFGLESAKLKLLRVQAVGHTKHVQRVCVPQRSRAPNISHSPSGQPTHPSAKSCWKKSRAESNMGIEVFSWLPISYSAWFIWGMMKSMLIKLDHFYLYARTGDKKHMEKTWKKHH